MNGEIMSALTFLKVNALPQQLAANAVYFVASTVNEQAVEIYVTNLDGSKSRKVFSSPDTSSESGEPSLTNLLKVVDTLADLDVIDTSLHNFVMVLDATADSGVEDGSAMYVYHEATSVWKKVSEVESMDLVLDWDNIQNGPKSTPGQIDDAVKDTHSHANAEVLNSLGKDEQGNLTLDGNVVTISWALTEW